MTEAKLENGPAVRNWLGSLKESTGLGYQWHFEAFIDWVRVNGGKFNDMTPEALVEYGLDASQRDMNDLLDLKKRYLLSMKGRLNHKKNANKAIQSFFSYNRVQLPKDSTLNLRGDVPKVEPAFTVEDLKKIVLASNPAFQATFLVMLGAGMGQDEFIQWSDTGYADLKKQLDSGASLVKIQLYGRKGDKNDYNYHTYIGGDALEALRKYLKIRGSQPGAIFINNIHRPATQSALYTYFDRKLKRLGMEPETEKNSDGQRWTGYSPHAIRDVFRTMWRRSGVPVEFGEYFMGHRGAFDKYGYDQTARDEDELRKQYLGALPFLNILSDTKPFRLVREDEVTHLRKELDETRAAQGGRVAELEAEVDRLKRGDGRVAELEAANLELSKRQEKLEKALMEIWEREKPVSEG